MEQLSSQDKKELFMSMVERAKNGTLDMMRMTETKEYDGIYRKLVNNYGPFGLVVGGITKDGKVSVYLAEQLSKQLPSNMVGGSMISSLEFEESELSDFLDRFYDMNNMEILNEFFKNQPDYVKNASLQEYKDEEHSDFYDRLVMLNALDYFNQPGNFHVKTLAGDDYECEVGLRVMSFEEGGNYCIVFGEGRDAVIYDVKAGEIKEKDFENPQFEKYLNRFLQSVEDLPRIYEAITKGTYRREDFIPAIETQVKQTPLQQKEAELSELEKKEKTIAEAETLIDKQNSKEGQNIGE